MKSETKYAIFDLDGTILKYNTMVLFCNYILQQERKRQLFLFLVVPACVLYFFKIISFIQLERIFFSFLYKMPKSQLNTYTKDFVKNVVHPLCFPEILEKIEYHKKQKHTLILNTASMHFCTEPIGEYLGFHTVFSTHVETQNFMPLFPKISVDNKGEEKIIAMLSILPKKFQKEYTLGKKSSLKNCYVYTDSIVDLPLTQLAEFVTVVLPKEKKFRNLTLENIALKKKWTLLYPKTETNLKFSEFKKFLHSILMFNGLWYKCEKNKEK